MDVAVVVPLFNGEKYIRETLESVEVQSLRPADVLVVDDGSTDGSREVAAQFPFVRLVRNPGKGVDEARNFGFRQTRSALVTFLDQDDVWHRDHLHRLVSFLQNNTYPVAVASHVMFRSVPALDVHEEGVRPYDPWRHFPNIRISTPSQVLIRRNALEEIGGWPTGYLGVADIFAWLALSVNRPFIRSTARTVGYRVHDESHSTMLRASRLHDYLDSFCGALDEAVGLRSSHRPEHREVLDLLTACVHGMSDAIRASADRDPERLSRAATRLEAIELRDTVVKKEAIIRRMWWFLGAQPDPEQLAFILDAWPQAAPETLRIVEEQSLTRTFLPRLIISRPASFMTWRVAARGTVTKIRNRMHRRRSGPRQAAGRRAARSG